MASTADMFALQMSTSQQIGSEIDPVSRVDVVVDDPKDLEQLLDRAVQHLIPTALERRQGILVTQIFSSQYTVEVDQRVLCGVIQEKRIDPACY